MLFDFTLDGTSFFVMIFSLTIEIYITSGLVWLIGEWVRLGGCSFAVVVGGCVTTVAIRTNCITTTCPWIESCEHDLQEKRGWSRTALWSQIDHSCDYRGGSQGVLLM
jgi:hypothetical protein